MFELFRRGSSVYYTDPGSLLIRPEGVFVRASRVTVLESEPYFVFHEKEILPAERFRVILIRKDPPFDPVYLHATQILSHVSTKTLVVNSPQILRDWNEKLAILDFPRWIPPTLVTADKGEIDLFVRTHGGEAILKPLDSFASKGVVRLSRDDPSQEGRSMREIDEATREGSYPVMIQAFLAKVSKEGEKRIFLVEGRPLGALLKTPPAEGFIANPDCGARLSATRLSSRESQLCRALGPVLKKRGVFFAGIDVIDGYLTEINITSPGLLWEWNEVDNRRHEREIIDLLEKRTSQR